MHGEKCKYTWLIMCSHVSVKNMEKDFPRYFSDHALSHFSTRRFYSIRYFIYFVLISLLFFFL